MYFNIIASGSKGNATVVVSKKARILIDMGISLARLEEGLKEINLKVKDLDAVLFTHNHTDHMKGLRFFSPKIMYALEGNLSSLANVIHLYEPFQINDMKITPVRVSHDATNPCAFVLEDEEDKLFYMTDTGCMLEEILPYAKDPTYLIIESNHDIRMLLRTNRTYELKNRIMSDVGHLCNEDSAIACVEIIGPHTKEIYLAHLSEEANTPELALEAYHKIFNHFQVDISRFVLKTAYQYQSVKGGHYED